MIRLGVAAVLAAALLAGCERPPEETKLRFTAMGTLVDVTIYGVPPDRARAAGERVESLFRDLHRAWDPWGDGALGQVNRSLAAGEPAALDPDLRQVLARARDLSGRSDGLFEPALGSLVKLWGFSRDEAQPEHPPPTAAIEVELARHAAIADLLNSGSRLSGPPGVMLDLGGFAKGVAVDRAVELLQRAGIANAIVNAGGDLRAIGRRGERPWRIGIRHPRKPGVLAAIEVQGDGAIFTSGDYERYFVHNGTRYHHILDPRTGRPAQGVASVTVAHAESGLADAAATALFVAGAENWPATAAQLGITEAMVIDTEGNISMTPAMQRRVRFIEDPPPGRIRVRELP